MTSLGWPLGEVADSVNGSVVGDDAILIDGVTTDSRQVESGSLFVAIEGENFDGNDFAVEALGRGAAAVLVRPGTDAEPRIEVADTSAALLSLAAKRRGELSVPVIAVTGSTGKTSTKDLLYAGIEGSWASPRSGLLEDSFSRPRVNSNFTARLRSEESRATRRSAWPRMCIRP